MQKIDTRDPLDRRGLPGTSICTKSLLRRSILRPYRGTQKLPPDCILVPISSAQLLFFTHDFLTDRRSSICWVWAAPGGQDTFHKGGERSPPPFWKVSWPPGAAQTLIIDALRSVKKSINQKPRSIAHRKQNPRTSYNIVHVFT